MSETKEKLEDCEVCGVNTAKYTCPKCELRTCSLKCVNIHKKELECDGLRDKTKYVPLSKFNNLDLLSDYRLLEEVTKSIETIKKDNFTRFAKCNNRLLPSHLYKLQQTLKNQSITLKFLPPTFDRHKCNTSYLDFKTKCIYWHIEWVFSNADNLKITDEKCRSDLKLAKIVHKYLDAGNYQDEKLKYYQSVGLGGIALYLKAERKPANKFYRLDPDLNLIESFTRKTIIEYPIIHVALKNHGVYDTIDSDDELSGETSESAEGNAVIQKIIKSAEKEDKGKNKNLLFVTEYSDGELSSD